jgi:c-di-GMP-binding flagellar brake protein YcgR
MGRPEDDVDNFLEPTDYTQYLLRAKSEVLFVLRGLVADSDRVTVYFNEGKDFLLTSVIAVDDTGLTLDYGSDETTNQRALDADKLFCVTNHEKVRVQFRLRGLRRIEAGDGPAFRAELPETVLRLQRREFYRLTTPIAHPLKCRIPLPRADGSSQNIEVTVVDISGGGLAVMVPPEGVNFEADTEFPNCRIELPEVGIVVATLQIRNLFDVTLRSGSRVSRAGCQFVNLPGPMLTLIQRYILKVERERKARETGMG